LSSLDEKLEKDVVCHRLYSTFTANVLPGKILEVSGDFKIVGKVMCTTKYTDGLVLLAKEETVLQGTKDELIETGGCCGVEKNVERTKVM